MSIPANYVQGISDSILSSSNVFYLVGGTILTVSAGIWGFNKIKDLFSDSFAPDWEKRGYSSQSDMDDAKSYFSSCQASIPSERRYVSDEAEERYYRRYGSEAWERRFSL